MRHGSNGRSRSVLPSNGPAGFVGSYVPQNLLATLYREVFGIDPATTLPDHTGRPMYLLDEWETIRELS